jgi:hypothetical protein
MNRAGAGGGAYMGSGATTIENCTISANAALGGGGGVYIAPNAAAVSIVSTIIAQNRVTAYPNAANPDIAGFTDSPANHNIIDEPAYLGPLGYHDGGTTETMLPSLDTLADYGTGLNPQSLSTDQNGEPFPTLASVIFIGAVQTTV